MKGGEKMPGFWELLKSSVLVQAIITLVLLLTIVYMYIVGLEVPDTLSAAFMAVLGFYFGSKVQTTIQGR